MKNPAGPIVVVDYDPVWREWFESLRALLAGVLGDLAPIIEHVGSTAVPGLAAKPIIDIDVIIDSRETLPEVVERLATVGYRHEGDLGIPGREAFRPPDGSIAHHLYVCERGNAASREHLRLRDYLRSHPDAVQAYAALKRRLAVQFRDDRAGYTQAKTGWIRCCLEAAWLATDLVEPD
ncbi:MAG TPA: GrpB family protein [Thermomicrobiaceae bacterium]|nr:GrpB family protein [Thermomicrobiaceae bacterium]